MASLDSLPGDQRAVLQLVLGRGRSYDEIARLLSIEPAAVRERALAAIEALGPQTKVDRQDRAMIGDYLLGQLPSGEVAEVRGRLSSSASQRAWARVLSSELAPLSDRSLPEIPIAGNGSSGEPPGVAAPRSAATTPSDAASATSESAATSTSAATSASDATSASAAAPPPADTEGGGRAGAPAGAPRSSRLGGAVLLGVGVLVVVGLVLFLVLGSGGSNKHPVASTPVTATSPVPGASSTTSAGSTAVKRVAQINLNPPSPGSKAVGVAAVLDEGSAQGIEIVAQHMPPNATHPPNAYAVWLYNSSADAHLLGFVVPGVGPKGQLQTAGLLPSNASRYKQLVITIETSAKPKAPGPIVLQGAVIGVR